MLCIYKQLQNIFKVKYVIYSLFFFVSLFHPTTHISAFTLEPQYVSSPSAGVVSTASDYSPAAQLFIFRVDTGAWIGNTDNSDITITDADWDGSTHFWIVPVISDSSGWGDCAYTFEACILDEAHYVSSVGYQQLYYVAGGGPGQIQNEPVLSNSFSNSSPEITISSPTKGSLFSYKGDIRYESIDRNDAGNSVEKSQGGLAENPVSLFYTDKVDSQNYTVINPAYKFPIALGLPAVGTYTWSIKDLIPGTLYRIIANATDRGNLLGETISDFFTVDYTAPVFKIKVDPPAVRKGDVTIFVEASEDLAILPQVMVTQKGGSPLAVNMSGEGSGYKGVYTIRSDRDGLAVVSVSGTDKAGNVGTTTVSGGSFSVGVNPPTAPVITYPLQGSVINEDFVDIKGSSREDTEVILIVNGVERAQTTPDSTGNFVFQKVLLDKVKNQGLNFISIIARDVFGSVSEAYDIDIKRNTPPSVVLTAPANNALVSDIYLLTAQGSDANGDTLLYTFQIAPFKSTSWSPLSEPLQSSGFSWNVTDVDDGEYMLRVIADDTIVRATSTPIRITVRNTLPFIRFENGRKTVSKDSTVTLYARAMSSNVLANRSAIQSVEYSLDRGLKWIPVKLTNTGTPYERKFSVMIPPLKEGIHPILWKIKDDRGLDGRTTHVLVIDKTAPQKPILLSPRNNSVLSSKDDKDSTVAGLQVDIGGTAEPGSQVTLSLGGNVMITKTSVNGRFSFPHTTFLKRGAIDINLFATDEAGNKGIGADSSFTYNNPPAIALLQPKPFHGLVGKARIAWRITDADGDSLQNTVISYRRFGESFKNLVTNGSSQGEFTWDVSNMPEANDYELRISTSDGITPISQISSFSIDETAPSVTSLVIKDSEKDVIGFSASGNVFDSVSGVEFIEYSLSSKSLREEKSWYKALITKGFGQKYASYSILHGATVEDGEYVLSVRAVDMAGNVSPEVTGSFKIDKTPPHIGSFFFEVDNVRLVSDTKGFISLPVTSTSTFGVSLESDVKKASLVVMGKTLSLKKDFTSGLWKTSLEIDRATTSLLFISAEDLQGNVIYQQNIGTLVGVLPGSISFNATNDTLLPVKDARIRVLKLNEETKRFAPLMTSSGTILDVNSDDRGNYDLILSQGSYELIVSAPGFKKIKQSVVVVRPELIHQSFVLKDISGVTRWIQNVFNRIQDLL